ncbi:YhcN/YlaJ family sporulation lipoprotein [Paenibacillus tarimensis]|uniref:YhcN/YlaJ family sporulation lipoprotein n=1 Tax=Paenibacillus tarimensis TaxID=416012 RepID=UPI001F1F2782|nr:YhcN/YlaJ family sporulation lipoprotein [Paenibacillus tarimensis]MCF2943035.1 YhcN/YlaJ family sporulation lipoprotein [Paenibacillus tarimensis]
MRRTTLGLAAILIGGSMLTGCSMERMGDVGNRNIRPNSVRFDANGNRVIDKRFANDQMNEMNRVYGRHLNSNNLIGNHQNYRIELSQDVAERLKGIAGVESATVILSNANAYVGIETAETPGDPSGMNADGSSRRSERMEPQGYPYMYGSTNPGRDSDPLRHGMGLKSTRTDTRDANGLRTPIEEPGGLDYPGGGEAGNTELSEAIKQQVAAEIKQMAPQIERVYVSSSPDFLGRMDRYRSEGEGGRPIQGYIAEFNAMVERMFPIDSGLRISERADSWIHR